MPPSASNRALQLVAVEPFGHHRERLGRDGRLVGGVVALRHGRCQAGDRRGPEQLGRVHDQARLPGPRDEADAEDRVDADLEEVVVDADAVPTQQLGRDPGEELLDGRARGAYGSADADINLLGRGRSAERSTLPLGESGNDATATDHDGTIASGRRSLSHRRRSAAAMPSDAAGTT